jgi:signal transduction histidine kinase
VDYGTNLNALAYAYAGQIIAFTICQLLLLRSDNRTQVVLWICASILSAISLLSAPHVLTVFSSPDLEVWAAFLSLLGGSFRYGALGFQAKGFVRDPWANKFFLVAIMGTPLAFLDILFDYRALITSVVGMSISLACFFVAKRNRFWVSSDSLGLKLVLVGMAVSASLLALRILTVYPFSLERNFVGLSPVAVFALAALVAISFFLQMGFTAMLVARQAKVLKFAARRKVRAWQRSAYLKDQAHKLSSIAEQRLDFIQLLTHEVRQPINNAQASLQSISSLLDATSAPSKDTEHALERAISSLDDITLPLSNIILLGTLAADNQKWHLQPVEAFDMLVMARLDCSFANRKRIFLTQPENNVFIDCVPIFLRIALHNLLTNALLWSEINSDINASIEVDEVNNGITFSIIYKKTKQKGFDLISLNKIVFNDTALSREQNFLMFVTKKISDYHKWHFFVQEFDDLNIKFELSLPS